MCVRQGLARLTWAIAPLMVMAVVTIVAASAAFAQAGSGDQPDAPQAALVGRVVVATRCPVPVGDDDGEICPAVGYPSTLTIRSADGSQELAEVSTDADGRFSIPLDPGVYLVQAPSTTAGVNTPQSLLVTVSPDSPTSLTIQVGRA